MSVDFTTDSAQDLQSSSIDLTGTNVITLAFWLYWDVFANDDKLALEFSSNYNSFTDAFSIFPNSSFTGFFDWGVRGDVGDSLARHARPSAGVWHHYVGVVDKGRSINEIGPVYVDGVSQALTHTINSNNTNNFGDHQLNFMSRNSASLFAEGKLAEVALYDSGLATDEAISLSKGFSPLLVKPESIVSYWPLVRDMVTDIVGGNNLTPSGSPPVDDHIGVVYPVSPFSGFGAAAVAAGHAGTLVNNPILKSKVWHPLVGSLCA